MGDKHSKFVYGLSLANMDTTETDWVYKALDAAVYAALDNGVIPHRLEVSPKIYKAFKMHASQKSFHPSIGMQKLMYTCEHGALDVDISLGALDPTYERISVIGDIVDGLSRAAMRLNGKINPHDKDCVGFKWE